MRTWRSIEQTKDPPDATSQLSLQNITFIQKQNKIHACEELARTHRFPEQHRVFEAVDRPVFSQHLVEG
jgi:hypothetical protein